MPGTHRLLWMLNTIKGLMILKEVERHAPDILGLVSSYTDPNVKENYGALIAEHCHTAGIDFIPWPNLRKSFKEQLAAAGITGMVAIGWQYLIPGNVWADLPDKLIVFHDSLLPRYRGFAPVPTAMINGETEFGVSVLYATNNIDDGELIAQDRVHIGREIYIGEALEQIGQLYCVAVRKLCQRIKDGSIEAQPQDHSKATYSIWRGSEDYAIDWSRSAFEIYNLIRAVSYPYPGAYSTLEGKRVRILRSEVVENDILFEIRQPGKIWCLEQGGRPVVVCGRGMLCITKMTAENGESVLPVTKLRLRFQ